MPSKLSAPKNQALAVPIEVAQGQAISYQRVSTQGQAAEDRSSFERQQEAFTTGVRGTQNIHRCRPTEPLAQEQKQAIEELISTLNKQKADLRSASTST